MTQIRSTSGGTHRSSTTTIASLIALGTLTATALAGCADPKAPSEENFRRVIEPLVRDKFCRSLDVRRLSLTTGTDLPPAFPVIVPEKPIMYADDERSRELLALMAKEGMLTRTAGIAPAQQAGGGEPLKPTGIISYQPTSKGAKLFRAMDRKLRSGDTIQLPAVCMGTGKVDRIVRWTDPADAFGQTLSQVTYTYSATDLPANAPAEMKADATRPKEAKVTLVRTSDGWQAMGR